MNTAILNTFYTTNGAEKHSIYFSFKKYLMEASDLKTKHLFNENKQQFSPMHQFRIQVSGLAWWKHFFETKNVQLRGHAVVLKHVQRHLSAADVTLFTKAI